MTSFEVLMFSLQAHVDRARAELLDPATTDARRAEIRAQLRPLYLALIEIVEHYQAPTE